MAELWIPIVIALIAAIPGGLSLIIALRKAPAESRSMNGEASSKFAEAARIAAEDIIAKSGRIDALEKELETTHKEVGELRIALAAEVKQRQRLEKWARTLTMQIKGLGGIPVSLEKANGD